MADKTKITGVITFPAGSNCIRFNLENIDMTDFAWDIYNFINEYKKGEFGIITLDKAFSERFPEFMENSPKKG